MVLTSNLIAEKNGRIIIHRNQNIHAAVVIEIPYSETTAGHWLCENRAALIANVPESCTRITKKQERFAVAHIGVNLFDEIIWMTVGDEQIQVAVVVVVKKFQTPATHGLGRSCNT